MVPVAQARTVAADIAALERNYPWIREAQDSTCQQALYLSGPPNEQPHLQHLFQRRARQKPNRGACEPANKYCAHRTFLWCWHDGSF